MTAQERERIIQVLIVAFQGGSTFFLYLVNEEAPNRVGGT